MPQHLVASPPVDSNLLRLPDAGVLDLRTRPVGGPASLAEADLASAIGRSDMIAFAEVYRRHAGQVRAMAVRLCGPNADDVVQDVFLRFWERPERFNSQRGSLTSFLLTLAHNRAVDVIRSEESRRAREAGVAARRTTADYRVEAHALARLEGEAVRAFLHRLPDTEREAIALAYLGGHTYREVAVLLRQPEGTIKTRVRSGLARLGGWIEEAQKRGPALRATA